MAGLWGSLLLLTRVPLPGPLAAAGGQNGASIAWFPFVGALLGGVLVTANLLLETAGLDPPIRATILVVLLAVLSGALHLDGLGDTADAVFAHATPERRMEIMRDPRVGTFGTVAIASALLLKVSAIQGIGPEGLLLAPVLGRWGIVLVAWAFPYARPGGMGEPLKAGATRRSVATASILPVGLGLALAPMGILAVGLAAIIAWLVGHWLCRHLPGLTGDSYGAVVESIETAVLLISTLA